MDYVRGRAVIFLNICSIASILLLIVAGIWDLYKKEIPVILLGSFSLIAVGIFFQTSVWEQAYDMILSLVLGITGGILIKCGKMGSGDLWMLICLGVIWPVDVFWTSFCYSVFILCTVAMGVWGMTGDGDLTIPMVPFLILGYWL